MTTTWPLGTTYNSKKWPFTLLSHDYSENFSQQLLDGRKADLIFADPPYNIGVGYDSDPSKDKVDGDEYRRFTKRVILKLIALARPGATFWWMTTEEHADWTGEILSNIVGPRLYRIVWQESFSQYQGDRALTKDYRFIFCHEVAHDLSGTVTFNPNDIRVQSVRQKMGDKRANPKGRVPGTTWDFGSSRDLDDLARQTNIDMINSTTSNDVAGRVGMIRAALDLVAGRGRVTGDIWNFRRLQGTARDRVDWHPAQLPPELLTRIVKGWSNPNDTVIDAFAGSGSMGKVCRALNRKFLGIERSPTYLTQMAKELSA